jgi:Sec-independent protein translocase protein TatA
LVVLLLFGAKKIIELARVNWERNDEFKKGLKDVEDEIKILINQIMARR